MVRVTAEGKEEDIIGGYLLHCADPSIILPLLYLVITLSCVDTQYRDSFISAPWAISSFIIADNIGCFYTRSVELS